jgi:hypothetical protein
MAGDGEQLAKGDRRCRQEYTGICDFLQCDSLGGTVKSPSKSHRQMTIADAGKDAGRPSWPKYDGCVVLFVLDMRRAARGPHAFETRRRARIRSQRQYSTVNLSFD